MRIGAIVLAAGKGERTGLDKNKMLFELNGVPVLEYTLRTFSNVEAVTDYVIVCKNEEKDIIEEICRRTLNSFTIAEGGLNRQDSVYNGLKAMANECDIVLIHDGARCFVSQTLIKACIEGCIAKGNAIAGKKCTDTVKQAIMSEQRLEATIDRSKLILVETPQTFYRQEILEAYRDGIEAGFVGTDDASFFERLGKPTYFVESDCDNMKITTPADLEKARKRIGSMRQLVGQGYDIHRLVENRKLILGGVEIPFEKGLLGHSDADVIIHALIDAILGATGKGDIGEWFPDTDMAYKDADSRILLQKVCSEILVDWDVENIDVTVFLEKPKMKEYKSKISLTLADIMKIEAFRINVKAKTMEKLGAIGEQQAIAASVTCLLKEKI